MSEIKRGVSNNAYQHLKEADANGDGYVSSEELALYLEFKRRELEDQDAQRDAMRKMAWFALFGMLLYPVTIIFTSWLDVDDAAAIIGNIAPTYFVAIAGLVAAFFGANAYTNSRNQNMQMPVQMPMNPSPRQTRSVTTTQETVVEEHEDEVPARVTPTRKVPSRKIV